MTGQHMFPMAYQKDIVYDRLPSNEDDVVPKQQHRNRKLLTIVVASVLLGIVVIVWHSRYQAPEVHKETIPTLLNVVDDKESGYIYALDNPVYDRFQQSPILLTKPLHVGYKEWPTLSLDRTYVSKNEDLTLTWTLGRDRRGRAIVQDDDVLALYCGDDDDHHDDWHILEVATIAQAKASSQRISSNENEWYMDRFPIIRHEMCRFKLFHQDGGRKSSYQLLAESQNVQLQSVTQPTAIHLALTEHANEMMIQFVTGSTTGTPIVLYGPDDTRVVGTASETYAAHDLCGAPANQTEPGKFQSPGQLHTILLSQLQPNTTYSYKVGLAHGQGTTWSDTYHFTSAPRVGDATPFSYIVYGDQGCPSAGWSEGSRYTSALTTREVNHGKIRAVHHFGDLSYAQGAAHQWDAWFEMVQPFAAHVPLMVAIGNHEYDYTSGGLGKDPSGVKEGHGFMPRWGDFADDSGGECGVPVSKRFRMPQSNTSNGVFWYSYDYANVRTTVISSEHDLSSGSPQHTWLEHDLKSVNRTKTPWVIVEVHRPLYNGADMPERTAVGIGMRYEMEDLLKDYRVDLVLAGHYHTYFRSCDGLYRSRCNHGGPTHITVGTAGAHLDNAKLLGNSWTAKYITQEYGYGRITVANASALRFEFVKASADNDTDMGEVHDDVWLIRDR